MVVNFTHSAVAEEMGYVERMVCDHLPGSIAGVFQTFLTISGGSSKKVMGREARCLANGDDMSVFEITAVV